MGATTEAHGEGPPGGYQGPDGPIWKSTGLFRRMTGPEWPGW